MTSMNPETSASARTTSMHTPMPSGLNPATTGTVNRHRVTSDETKWSWRTTEFLAYIGSVLAVILTSASIGNGDGPNNDSDYFAADKALLYITILTVGYMLSRGLAKAGSRHIDNDY